MGELEDFEDLILEGGINPKTGKPNGEPGRPSNLWREFQDFQAYRALLNQGFGSVSLGSKEESSEGGDGSDNGLLRGLGEIAGNPILGSILGSKPVGIIAAILALWTAEETIPSMPPILHTLLKLLDLTGNTMLGKDKGLTELLLGELTSDMNEIPALQQSHTFQEYDVRHSNPYTGVNYVIPSFVDWINRKPHVMIAKKSIEELVDEWFKPSGLMITSGKVYKKLGIVMANPLVPITEHQVNEFDEIFSLSKYKNPLGFRAAVTKEADRPSL